MAMQGPSDRPDGLADGIQEAADLAAKEDQRDDRDDGDEREDQRVFGKARSSSSRRSEAMTVEMSANGWLPF